MVEPDIHIKAKILTGDTDITSDSISVQVNIRENKINDAVMVANDDAGKTYITNLALGDLVSIWFAYVDDVTDPSSATYSEIFYGEVVSLEPQVIADSGALCKVQLYAYPAIALNRMRTASQYSINPYNLQTLREIYVSGAGSLNPSDFPFSDWYTEENFSLTPSSGPTDPNGWSIGNGGVGTPTLAFNTTTVPSASNTTVSIQMYTEGGRAADFWFPYNYGDVHGFPLYIEDYSRPIFNWETGSWELNTIPYIKFWLMRDDDTHDVQLKLKTSDSDYLQFQFSHQDHGMYSGNGNGYPHNVNMLPTNTWVYFEIPIGSKWDRADIYVTPLGGSRSNLITSTQASNSGDIGNNLKTLCGWNFNHQLMADTDSGGNEAKIWNNIVGIGFGVQKMLIAPFGNAACNLYLNDLVLVDLNPNSPSIIPDYVNTAFTIESTDYGINTDYISDYLDSSADSYLQHVPYMQFIYEPITKALKNTLDLIQGYNWAVNQLSGKHWIMIGNNLCIAPVDNHNVTGIHWLALEDITSGDNYIVISSSYYGNLYVGQQIQIGDSTGASQTGTIVTINPPSTYDGIPNSIDIVVSFNMGTTYHMSNSAYIAPLMSGIWSLLSKYTQDNPLVLSEDIVRENFKHSEPEANFVLINGVYQVPPQNDWLQNIDKQGSIIYLPTLPPTPRWVATTGAGGYNNTTGFQGWVLLGPETDYEVWLNFYSSYGNDAWTPISGGIEGPYCLTSTVTGAVSGPSGILGLFNLPTQSGSAAVEYILTNPIDLSLIQNAHLTFWVSTMNLDHLEVRIFVGDNLPSTNTSDSLNAVGARPTPSLTSMLPLILGGTGNWAYTFVDLIRFGSGDSNYGDYFWYQPKEAATYGRTGWTKIDLPIGMNDGGSWNIMHNASWSKKIQAIVLVAFGGWYNGFVMFDNLNINGQTVRVAQSSKSIATMGMKTKIINESVISGYSQNPSIADPLDSICIAECLRCVGIPTYGSNNTITARTPFTTGEVTIPFDPSLLGGQQVYIQSTSFGSNPKCFRIQYVSHIYSQSGALTTIHVTDDLSNSYSTDPTDQASNAIKAVNPDFQTRDYVRLKTTNMLWNSQISKLIDIDTW